MTLFSGPSPGKAQSQPVAGLSSILNVAADVSSSSLLPETLPPSGGPPGSIPNDLQASNSSSDFHGENSFFHVNSSTKSQLPPISSLSPMIRHQIRSEMRQMLPSASTLSHRREAADFPGVAASLTISHPRSAAELQHESTANLDELTNQNNIFTIAGGLNKNADHMLGTTLSTPQQRTSRPDRCIRSFVSESSGLRTCDLSHVQLLAHEAIWSSASPKAPVVEAVAAVAYRSPVRRKTFANSSPTSKNHRESAERYHGKSACVALALAGFRQLSQDGDDISAPSGSSAPIQNPRTLVDSEIHGSEFSPSDITNSCSPSPLRFREDYGLVRAHTIHMLPTTEEMLEERRALAQLDAMMFHPVTAAGEPHSCQHSHSNPPPAMRNTKRHEEEQVTTPKFVKQDIQKSGPGEQIDDLTHSEKLIGVPSELKPPTVHRNVAAQKQKRRPLITMDLIDRFTDLAPYPPTRSPNQRHVFRVTSGTGAACRQMQITSAQRAAETLSSFLGNYGTGDGTTSLASIPSFPDQHSLSLPGPVPLFNASSHYPLSSGVTNCAKVTPSGVGGASSVVTAAIPHLLSPLMPPSVGVSAGPAPRLCLMLPPTMSDSGGLTFHQPLIPSSIDSSGYAPSSERMLDHFAYLREPRSCQITQSFTDDHDSQRRSSLLDGRNMHFQSTSTEVHDGDGVASKYLDLDITKQETFSDRSQLGNAASCGVLQPRNNTENPEFYGMPYTNTGNADRNMDNAQGQSLQQSTQRSHPFQVSVNPLGMSDYVSIHPLSSNSLLHLPHEIHLLNHCYPFPVASPAASVDPSHPVLYDTAAPSHRPSDDVQGAAGAASNGRPVSSSIDSTVDGRQCFADESLSDLCDFRAPTSGRLSASPLRQIQAGGNERSLNSNNQSTLRGDEKTLSMDRRTSVSHLMGDEYPRATNPRRSTCGSFNDRESIKYSSTPPRHDVSTANDSTLNESTEDLHSLAATASRAAVTAVASPFLSAGDNCLSVANIMREFEKYESANPTYLDAPSSHVNRDNEPRNHDVAMRMAFAYDGDASSAATQFGNNGFTADSIRNRVESSRIAESLNDQSSSLRSSIWSTAPFPSGSFAYSDDMFHKRHNPSSSSLCEQKASYDEQHRSLLRSPSQQFSSPIRDASPFSSQNFRSAPQLVANVDARTASRRYSTPRATTMPPIHDSSLLRRLQLQQQDATPPLATLSNGPSTPLHSATYTPNPCDLFSPSTPIGFNAARHSLVCAGHTLPMSPGAMRPHERTASRFLPGTPPKSPVPSFSEPSANSASGSSAQFPSASAGNYISATTPTSNHTSGAASISPSTAATTPETSNTHSFSGSSVGAALHPGNCKPCAFVWTKGCINGKNCQFCHEWHLPKKKKPMKDQKNLMIIARPDGKIEFLRCTIDEALRVCY